MCSWKSAGNINMTSEKRWLSRTVSVSEYLCCSCKASMIALLMAAPSPWIQIVCMLNAAL